ncbi:MAG TPA: hypothetical protein VHY56_01410 [Candidatus Binataceae bacterium]|nr:hypothetical protein [Candidatus Binataceae bacterium]
MSFGLGLTIAVMAMIGVTLLIGQICHIGNLEQDPLDNPVAKRPGGGALRVVGAEFRRKR